MSARPGSRPAPRPKPTREIPLAEVRRLLAPPLREPSRHAERLITWVFTWTICRQIAGRFETIDAAANAGEAREIASRHPGAIVMHRALKLVEFVEDF